MKKSKCKLFVSLFMITSLFNLVGCDKKDDKHKIHFPYFSIYIDSQSCCFFDCYNPNYGILKYSNKEELYSLSGADTAKALETINEIPLDYRIDAKKIEINTPLGEKNNLNYVAIKVSFHYFHSTDGDLARPIFYFFEDGSYGLLNHSRTTFVYSNMKKYDYKKFIKKVEKLPKQESDGHMYE